MRMMMVVVFTALIGVPTQADTIPPCPVPAGMASVSMEHVPAPVWKDLTKSSDDIAAPGEPFNVGDVHIPGDKHRRLIFVWQKGRRWVIATEHGGLGYNDPIYAYDLLPDQTAVLMKRETAFPNSVCRIAEKLSSPDLVETPPYVQRLSAKGLGTENKAGLWLDRVHSNAALYVSRDYRAGNLPPSQLQQLSDGFMAKIDEARHVCATQDQAQHPRMLVRTGDTCMPGPVTKRLFSVSFDLTCPDTTTYRAEIEMDAPTHAKVTLTDLAPKLNAPSAVVQHDLYWLSQDCGDLKPGEMRKVAPTRYLNHPAAEDGPKPR